MIAIETNKLHAKCNYKLNDVTHINSLIEYRSHTFYTPLLFHEHINIQYLRHPFGLVIHQSKKEV